MIAHSHPGFFARARHARENDIAGVAGAVGNFNIVLIGMTLMGTMAMASDERLARVVCDRNIGTTRAEASHLFGGSAMLSRGALVELELDAGAEAYAGGAEAERF